MADFLVINTGPLIALERMGCLDILDGLPFQFICPEEVRNELDEGEVSGYPRIHPSSVAITQLRSMPTPFGIAGLDIGETAVIQLALERGISLVAIDEWKGRRMASALGLRVTGSLGLLAKAKAVGLIPAIKPFVERASTGGIHYHSELVAAILREVNEV